MWYNNCTMCNSSQRNWLAATRVANYTGKPQLAEKMLWRALPRLRMWYNVCTECKPSRYNRLAVARHRIIPSSYGLKSKYPKGCFLFCARSIMIARSANQADTIGLPSRGPDYTVKPIKYFVRRF